MNFLIIELYMSLIAIILIISASVKDHKINTTIGLMIWYSIITLFIIYESKFEQGANIYLLHFNLKIDNIVWLMKMIIMLFLINYIYMTKNYFNLERVYIKEFTVVIWIGIIGVFFIIMSNEFFILYLALELQNLILYIITTLKRYRSQSIEAGVKYYIMGSFSSGLLLYGIVMLFGLFGTLDFIEISYLIKDMSYLGFDLGYLIYFLFFIIIGLLFKLGVAPFHWWVPEVYEGASILVTLYFAIIPKLSLIIILYKIYINILIYVNFVFNSFFFFISFITLFIGFIFSLYQKKIIKFLAYSSIFNTGFFIACFSNGTFFSLISLLYFFLPYIFILLGIFFILISYRKLNNEKLILLWDLSLIGNSHVLLGFILSIFFFSLAGIPPLSGFFGKFFIFLSLILNKFWVLFFILLVFSLLSSFYYFRVIRFIFFSNIIEYIYIKPYLNNLLLSIYFFISFFFLFFFDYFFIFFLNIISSSLIYG